jgi:hypothetical protein
MLNCAKFQLAWICFCFIFLFSWRNSFGDEKSGKSWQLCFFDRVNFEFREGKSVRSFFLTFGFVRGSRNGDEKREKYVATLIWRFLIG